MPAHGREAPNWVVPMGITEQRARAMNDALDVAASDLTHRQWANSARAMWHSRLKQKLLRNDC